MKRLLFALLAVLTLLPLTACGKSGDGDWKFTANGVTLTVGETCSDVLKTLSSSCSKNTPSASCWEKTGEDVVYEYRSLGFRLKTYRKEENDPNELLRGIEFLSDTAKTPEGITIGSTEDAVRAAYGTPTKEDGDMLSYVKGKTELQLTVRDGKVKSIGYFTVG